MKKILNNTLYPTVCQIIAKKTKNMKMPKNMPMAIKKKRTKREQEIYDSGYHNGIQKGKREKIEEIKRILEIEQERSITDV